MKKSARIMGVVLGSVQPEGLSGFWKREGDLEPERWGSSLGFSTVG